MGFESGMFQTGNFHLRRLGTEKTPTQTDRSNGNTEGSAAVAPKTSELNRVIEDRLIYTGGELGSINAPCERNTIVEATTPDEHWDDQSQSSQARIIKETREWTIDYNNGPEPLNKDNISAEARM